MWALTTYQTTNFFESSNNNGNLGWTWKTLSVTEALSGLKDASVACLANLSKLCKGFHPDCIIFTSLSKHSLCLSVSGESRAHTRLRLLLSRASDRRGGKSAPSGHQQEPPHAGTAVVPWRQSGSLGHTSFCSGPQPEKDWTRAWDGATERCFTVGKKGVYFYLRVSLSLTPTHLHRHTRFFYFTYYTSTHTPWGICASLDDTYLK